VAALIACSRAAIGGSRTDSSKRFAIGIACAAVEIATKGEATLAILQTGNRGGLTRRYAVTESIACARAALGARRADACD